MGNHIEETVKLIGSLLIELNGVGLIEAISFIGLGVVTVLFIFSFGIGLPVSLEPHCSQKLFAVGFLVLQLVHTFVSAIPNSLGGLIRKNLRKLAKFQVTIAIVQSFCQQNQLLSLIKLMTKLKLRKYEVF